MSMYRWMLSPSRSWYWTSGSDSGTSNARVSTMSYCGGGCSRSTSSGSSAGACSSPCGGLRRRQQWLRAALRALRQSGCGQRLAQAGPAAPGRLSLQWRLRLRHGHNCGAAGVAEEAGGDDIGAVDGRARRVRRQLVAERGADVADDCQHGVARPGGRQLGGHARQRKPVRQPMLSTFRRLMSGRSPSSRARYVSRVGACIVPVIVPCAQQLAICDVLVDPFQGAVLMQTAVVIAWGLNMQASWRSELLQCFCRWG